MRRFKVRGAYMSGFRSDSASQRLPTEFVNRRRVVILAGPQNGGGEIGLIRRIRVVLSFQAKAQVTRVGVAVRTNKCTGTEVGVENLDAGLGGEDFHGPAGFWIL